MTRYRTIYHGTGHPWRPMDGEPLGRPIRTRSGGAGESTVFGVGMEFNADWRRARQRRGSPLRPLGDAPEHGPRIAAQSLLRHRVLDEARALMVRTYIRGDDSDLDEAAIDWVLADAQRDLDRDTALYELTVPAEDLERLFDHAATLVDQPEAVRDRLCGEWPHLFEAQWIDDNNGRTIPDAEIAAEDAGHEELAERGIRRRVPADSLRWEGLVEAVRPANSGPTDAREAVTTHLSGLGVPGLAYSDGIVGDDASPGLPSFVIWDQAVLDRMEVVATIAAGDEAPEPAADLVRADRSSDAEEDERRMTP